MQWKFATCKGLKTRGQPAGFIDKIFTFMLRILYNLNKNFLTIGTGMVYYLLRVLRKASYLIFGFILFFGLPASADMPGNTPRSDVTVTIKNVQLLGGYVLHVLDYDKDIIIAHDTVYNIYASRGVPHSIMIWAVQNSSTTDSLFFDEFQQNNYVVELKGVSGKNILYDLKQTPVSTGDAADSLVNGAADVSLADIWKTNELLIGISFVALLGLIFYFLWRKKKKGKGNIDAAL